MTRRAAALLAPALIATLLLGPVIGTVAAPVAQAATAAECDALVFDASGAISDDPRLQDAVGSATRAGILARVRLYDTVPGGDLDAYIAELQAQCRSWLSPDGNRRSNLLVLAVSRGDRTTGLYYGSAYEGALGDQWNRIQADLMNPPFRDGDYAAGLAAGLAETTTVIQDWQHPGSASAAADTSSGLSGTLLAVLGSLVVLAGLVVGSVFAVRHLRRRRGEQDAVAAARARAQTAYEDASAAFLAMDGSTRSAAGANAAVMALVSDQDDQELAGALAAAQAAVDAASVRWIAAQERWGTGALDRASEDEAKAARATLAALASDLRDADAMVTAAGARALDLTAMGEALPARLQEARDQIAAAVTSLDAGAAAGLDMASGRQVVATAAADLDGAAAMIDDRRFSEAAAVIAEAGDRAQTVERECAELPSRLDTSTGALAEAAASVGDRRTAQAAAEASLGELRSAYGSASIADIDEPVTGIGRRLDESDRRIDEARAALALRSLDAPTQADACCASVAESLAAVDEALAALRARSAELPALAVELPVRLAAVDQAIEQARAYASEHAQDVDPARSGEMDALQARAQQLGVDLAAPRGDLPRIGEQCRDLEAGVAAVAAAATGDVREAEAERTKAQAALNRAKADLDASESVLARLGETGSSRGSLRQARSTLARAQASSDLALIVSLAAQASEQAERAARSAREAHEQAQTASEHEDRSYRADREDRQYGSGDSGGGGGSTDFGSGGGGGGSSKW